MPLETPTHSVDRRPLGRTERPARQAVQRDPAAPRARMRAALGGAGAAHRIGGGEEGCIEQAGGQGAAAEHADEMPAASGLSGRVRGRAGGWVCRAGAGRGARGAVRPHEGDVGHEELREEEHRDGVRARRHLHTEHVHNLPRSARVSRRHGGGPEVRCRPQAPRGSLPASKAMRRAGSAQRQLAGWWWWGITSPCSLWFLLPAECPIT